MLSEPFFSVSSTCWRMRFLPRTRFGWFSSACSPGPCKSRSWQTHYDPGKITHPILCQSKGLHSPIFFFSFFFPFLFLLFLIYFLSMATCLDQQIQWSLEAEYCTRRVRNTSPWLTTFITKFALSHQVPVQITQNIKRKIDKHFRRAEASPSFFTAAVAPAFWKHGGIDPGHTPSCWMKNRPSLCQSEWAQSRTRHFVPFWKPKG